MSICLDGALTEHAGERAAAGRCGQLPRGVIAMRMTYNNQLGLTQAYNRDLAVHFSHMNAFNFAFLRRVCCLPAHSKAGE
jgi:hypothetical protein